MFHNRNELAFGTRPICIRRHAGGFKFDCYFKNLKTLQIKHSIIGISTPSGSIMAAFD